MRHSDDAERRPGWLRRIPPVKRSHQLEQTDRPLGWFVDALIENYRSTTNRRRNGRAVLNSNHPLEPEMWTAVSSCVFRKACCRGSPLERGLHVTIQAYQTQNASAWRSPSAGPAGRSPDTTHPRQDIVSTLPPLDCDWSGGTPRVPKNGCQCPRVECCSPDRLQRASCRRG